MARYRLVAVRSTTDGEVALLKGADVMTGDDLAVVQQRKVTEAAKHADLLSFLIFEDAADYATLVRQISGTAGA